MTSSRLATRTGAFVLLVGLGVAAYRQGGYHEAQHRVLAVGVLVAGATLLVSRAFSSIRLAASVVAPLALSTLVSVLAADDRGDAASTVLTVSLVAVALAIGTSLDEHDRERTVDALLLVAALVAATAIWGVASHTGPWGRVTAGVWRGSSSITYSNAAAAVVGPSALLAFWIALRSAHRRYIVLATLLLIGFAATQSRGGALAFALAGCVLVARSDRDTVIRAGLPVAVGIGIGVTPLLVLAPDAGTPRPAFVVASVLVGLVASASIAAVRTRLTRPGVTLIALAVGAVAIGAATGIASAVSTRLTLRSGTTAEGPSANVLFGDRAQVWETAWDRFLDAPLIGHGPGNVDLRWTQDGRTFEAEFVHNEFLELAVTHGVLGVVAFVLAVLIAVRHWRRDDLSAGVALCVATFLVHSSVDFLWHVPLLPVFFGLCVGLALSPPMSASSSAAARD